MRTSLDSLHKEQIISRITKLNPDSMALWGNMTVNQMLFHCRKINNEVMEAKESTKRPSIKQKVIKIVGLHILNGFPKGVRTGSKYLPAENDVLDFRNLQNELIQNIEFIAAYPDTINGEHPFFGSLNTKEWRRFFWMHMDHHLRQFNV